MATAIRLEKFQTLGDILGPLGDVAPSRVRFHPTPGTATEADLIAVNARNQGICELVDGILVEKAMGYAESVLALWLGGMLNAFIVARNLGLISGADGMMRLFPGLVRVPDLAFASWDRIPDRRRPTTSIAGFAPDLAIEILSPSNRKAEMKRQRTEYFAAGVRLVWEVDPKKRIVTTDHAPEQATVLDASMTLEGGDVLPGFALALADLFDELDRHGA